MVEVVGGELAREVCCCWSLLGQMASRYDVMWDEPRVRLRAGLGPNLAKPHNTPNPTISC